MRDGNVSSYSTANGNQLTTTVENYVNGALVNTTTSLTHVYDNRNQLIQTTTNSNDVIEYVYNGEGYRTEKTTDGNTVHYLYEYDKVVLEVDDIGQEIAWNVYGLNLLYRRVDGDSYYYMYNGHADVVTLIDTTTKTVEATYYYDDFGNILESTGNVNNSITYAGYQYDEETDLYYLNARMYDPKVARFLQEDTYRGSAKDPLSLNLYAYCANNPITYVDPTGHRYVVDDKGDVTVNPKTNKLMGDEKSITEAPSSSTKGSTTDKGGWGGAVDGIKSVPENMLNQVKGLYSLKDADVRQQVWNNSIQWLAMSTEEKDQWWDDYVRYSDYERAKFATSFLGEAYVGAALGKAGKLAKVSVLNKVDDVGKAKTITNGIAKTSNRLNLGAGDNILDDAINVDIRQLDGIDVVADASKLPFESGYFDEIIVQNPFDYDVLSSDVARVMSSGGELKVIGGPKNKFFMNVYNASDDILDSYGYELISKGSASDELMFGTQKTTSGMAFSEKALKKQLEIILRRK